MIYKTTYIENGHQFERDCTLSEISEIDARKASPEVANAPIANQIAAIEGTVTPRRLREAVTTTDGKTWLADIDAQIAALRAQLK